MAEFMRGHANKKAGHRAMDKEHENAAQPLLLRPE